MTTRILIPITIRDEYDRPQHINVTDYIIQKGHKAASSHWENGLDIPPEADYLYDIFAHWADTGEELTEDEFELYGDQIIEGIKASRESL